MSKKSIRTLSVAESPRVSLDDGGQPNKPIYAVPTSNDPPSQYAQVNSLIAEKRDIIAAMQKVNTYEALREQIEAAADLL